MSLTAVKDNSYRKDAKTRRVLKSFFLICTLIIFFSSKIYSQNKGDTCCVKEKNSFIFSLGYGYPPFSLFIQSPYSGGESETSTGYLFLRGEWKRQKSRSSFGFNLFLGLMNFANQGGLGGGGLRTGSITSGGGIGLRYNYYFIYRSRFQLYGALGIGAQADEFSLAYIYGEVFIGVRGAISKRIWAFTELGAGKTFAQAGLSFKFN